MVRAILGAVQSRSEHPVAAPFAGWTGEGRSVAVENLRALPAVGLAAEVTHAGRNHAVEVGNDRLVNGDMPWIGHLPNKRTIAMKLDGKLVALAELDEELRSGAGQALVELANEGYRVTVLTGDNTAPSALTNTGLDVRTGLSPEEKSAIVQSWEEQRESVLYLGDGLNDSAASAAASASLALGAAHSVTIAASQAVWPHPHLDQLPSLLRAARDVVRQGRRIVGLSFAYNTLGIAAAASGYLHPVFAAILMLVSSLSVTSLAAHAGGKANRVHPVGHLAANC